MIAAAAAGAAFAFPLTRSAKTGATALPFYESRDFTPRWSEVEHRVAPFQLLDQKHRGFTERDLDGKVHVASFLFTSCPGVCPTLVERLKPVQAAIRGRQDVVMISYSVTPRTDTPAVLGEFGALRGIDPETWRLVTGDLAEIQRVIRGSYFADDERGGSEGMESRLIHTEKVILVDGRRRLRGIYNGTHAFEMDRLIEDIETLRHETAAR
jgi:protein SCO1/2